MRRTTLPLALTIAFAAGCAQEPATAPEFDVQLTKVAQGPATVTGEIGPGAQYSLHIPDGWNGDLVLYAHGYRFRDAPVALPDNIDALRDGLLAMGYGVAYSSYSENGFALKDGLTRTRQLRGLFTSTFGPPSSTYIIGHSLGGLVSLMAAEQNPGLFAGAMPMCSLVGGSQVQTDYLTHVRVLFDYFYPGVIPGSPVDPDDDLVFFDLVPAIVGAILANPLGAIQMAAVDQSAMVYNDLNELLNSIIIALYFNVEASPDLVDRAHGQSFFDNTATVYAGSFDDTAVNAGVGRFASRPDAQRWLDNVYQPDGRLSVPVLTLHTTRDPLVPAFHEPIYADIVAAAGRSDHLVQRSIDRFGHCAFDPAEELAAFADLAAWSETGVPPTP